MRLSLTRRIAFPLHASRPLIPPLSIKTPRLSPCSSTTRRTLFVKHKTLERFVDYLGSDAVSNWPFLQNWFAKALSVSFKPRIVALEEHLKTQGATKEERDWHQQRVLDFAIGDSLVLTPLIMWFLTENGLLPKTPQKPEAK